MIIADAEVRIFWYSGKLALPSGVLASARKSPPVSAMTGGIKLRGPERVRTHLRVSSSWIRIKASRAHAVPNSSARQLRANLYEAGRRPKGRPRGRASAPGHPLFPDEPWSISSVPYIQYTRCDPTRLSELNGKFIRSRMVRKLELRDRVACLAPFG